MVWSKVTDPEKFVYEDVAIAAYLLVRLCDLSGVEGWKESPRQLRVFIVLSVNIGLP